MSKDKVAATRDVNETPSIKGITSSTMKANSSGLVDSITQNNRLMARLQSRPARKVSWHQRVWWKLKDAWPLQWKERDEDW